MTTSQTGLRDVPALRRSLGGGRALACRSPLALCLPRRLGGVLPNRAASEMFRHVARCSAMSHHVPLFSLYTKTASFFQVPEAAARSNRKLPRRLEASQAIIHSRGAALLRSLRSLIRYSQLFNRRRGEPGGKAPRSRR